MLKILKENEKRMDGHFAVEIFEVEDFGLIAVDNDTSNGETMDKNTSNFRVREVQEPVSNDEDGEPDQWRLVGFEIE